MKKLVLVMLMLCVSLVGLAEAGRRCRRGGCYTEDVKQVEAGIKADAPDLIKLGKDLTLGAEIKKDLLRTDFNEGWGYYAKVTYRGCLINCK